MLARKIHFAILLSILTVSVQVRVSGCPSLQEYQNRRQQYAQQVTRGITVLFNTPESDLTEVVPDKDFYYFTGITEPDAVLVLAPRNSRHRETLFVRSRNPEKERYTGPRLEAGEASAQRLGIERVMELPHLSAELRRLAEGEDEVYTHLPAGDALQFAWLSVQVERLKSVLPFARIREMQSYSARLRMRKSPAELDCLRKAIAITQAAQREAAKAIAPGKFEYEIEAVLEFEFRKRGATRPGFPSIVGSGPNSTILHYDKNSRRMQSGDVVIVDIGAEFSGYTADVTRTFPVNGKFSERQRAIYEIVLGAQEAALKAVRPGALISKSGSIHRTAFDYIDRHGKDSKGGSLSRFFIHGTSHHLGLDVHDTVDDNNTPLEPGMVITVEPGIYIPEEQLGIRIEDVVLVTETGYELLSRSLPRRPEEIEALMTDRSQD
ncbi:MAG: aminopeptidase P N-terminal domain-containing protein [Acidobacteriota bacterium]